MTHLGRQGALFLAACLLAAGCANLVVLKYSIDIPPDVPRVAKAQDKDCKVVTIKPRRAYARWHMQGWIICLEGFIEKNIDLSNERPLLPAIQSWGFATRGQEEGYHQCRRLLVEQIELHGEEAVRARTESLLKSLRDTWHNAKAPHWRQEF
jgi:hypothetical protein